jgi:adenylate cyclase
MDDVLGALEAQLLELQKYKARFGELVPESSTSNILTNRKKPTRQSSRQSKQIKVDSQQMAS